MLFKRISRTGAETVFLVAQNVSGSTLTAGYSCVFDVSASVNGVRVTQASSTDLSAFAGIASSDIANSGYGLLQVYGYRSSIRVYSSAGSSASGDVLQTVAGQWGLQPATTGAQAQGWGFLCEAITASGSSSNYLCTAKAFIRAL